MIELKYEKPDWLMSKIRAYVQKMDLEKKKKQTETKTDKKENKK